MVQIMFCYRDVAVTENYLEHFTTNQHLEIYKQKTKKTYRDWYPSIVEGDI